MKISKRIILIYSILTVIISFALGFSVYIYSSYYSQRMFFKILSDRSFIIAQNFLKEDEYAKDRYDAVRREYLKPLTGENIEIYDTLNKLAFINTSRKTDAHEFKTDIIKQIRQSKYLEFSQNDRQAVGIFFKDNQGDFVIIISAYDSYGKKNLNNLLNILLVCGLINLILVFLAGKFIAVQILKPFNKIIEDTHQINASNLHRRLKLNVGKDEIYELQCTVNLMLDRLENSFQQQKTFINNASHELKNPITAVLGQLEVSKSKFRSIDEYHDTIDIVYNEVNRLNNLITDLLNLAQYNFDETDMLLDDVNLEEIILNVISQIKKENQQSVIKLHFATMPESPEVLIIHGNSGLLFSAFYNIIYNACKYSDFKPVEVEISFSNKIIVIEISDYGIGIPPEDLLNVFEPFYRAENTRHTKGTGLGLSLAKRILNLHKASIAVKSKLNESTVFRIEFSI